MASTPQIWKVLKSIICKFWNVNKMDFFLHKAWCQGPGELTYWTLFIRKYKGYEYHFLTWVVKTYISIWNHHPQEWQKPNFSEVLIQHFSLNCLGFIQVQGQPVLKHCHGSEEGENVCGKTTILFSSSLSRHIEVCWNVHHTLWPSIIFPVGNPRDSLCSRQNVLLSSGALSLFMVGNNLEDSSEFLDSSLCLYEFKLLETKVRSTLFFPALGYFITLVMRH